jgi:S1-C subfamily serine protease
VIEKAQEIEITLGNRKHRAQLVGTDPLTDVAVIRIEGAHLDALPWGDSAQARVGEYVLAVGNPFHLSQTVTMGIISAVGRSNIGIVDYEDFIQTDAAINPGNSGGALVNTRGELIGINTAIYSETGGYQGIGFAVPANLARQVVDDILEFGHVRRGFIGITEIRDVANGVLVVALLRGSPAHRAGVQPGDVIVSVDGRAGLDASALRHDLAGARPGVELHIEVLRGGQKLPLHISVEAAPTDA